MSMTVGSPHSRMMGGGMPQASRIHTTRLIHCSCPGQSWPRRSKRRTAMLSARSPTCWRVQVSASLRSGTRRGLRWFVTGRPGARWDAEGHETDSTFAIRILRARVPFGLSLPQLQGVTWFERIQVCRDREPRRLTTACWPRYGHLRRRRDRGHDDDRVRFVHSRLLRYPSGGPEVASRGPGGGGCPRPFLPSGLARHPSGWLSEVTSLAPWSRRR